jgi:hypothetical protein
MDMFNRYLMRGSGERRAQPANASERATYAALDFMKQNGIAIPGATEQDKSRFVDGLFHAIAGAI